MRRRTAAVLALPLVLAACSGGSRADRNPTAGGSPSCPSGGATIPARCVSDVQPSADVFPGDPAKIKAVSLGAPTAKESSLGDASNAGDPKRHGATFTVTVPAGTRIGSSMVCFGNGEITLDTVPRSDAYQSFKCNNGSGIPSELTAESPDPLTTTTTFTVTVTATGVNRWAARVYSTTETVHVIDVK